MLAFRLAADEQTRPPPDLLAAFLRRRRVSPQILRSEARGEARNAAWPDSDAGNSAHEATFRIPSAGLCHCQTALRRHLATVADAKRSRIAPNSSALHNGTYAQRRLPAVTVGASATIGSMASPPPGVPEHCPCIPETARRCQCRRRWRNPLPVWRCILVNTCTGHTTLSMRAA